MTTANGDLDAGMPEAFVTDKRLGQILGLSTKTVQRWRRAGMPSETWGMANTRRYLPSACIAWARARDIDRIPQQQDQAARLITAGRSQTEGP